MKKFLIPIFILISTLLFSAPAGWNHYTSAFKYLKKKQISNAENSFKKALKDFPENGKYNRSYAWFLQRYKKDDLKAEKYFLKALQYPKTLDNKKAVYHNLGNLYYRRGNLYRKKGNHLYAAKNYLLSVKQLPANHPQGQNSRVMAKVSLEKLGNIALAQGKYKKALKYFEQALKVYEKVKQDRLKKSYKKWKKRVNPKTLKAYQYRGLYRKYENYLYKFSIAETQLKSILLKKKIKVRKNAAVYKIGVLVIRNQDTDYFHNGKKMRERAYLSDEKLKQYKSSLKMAEKFIELYSKEKVDIKIDWIDYPKGTVKGLKQRNYGGLFNIRTLNPDKIIPYPNKILKEMTEKYDTIMFCWPSKKAALAFGGGRMQIKVNGKKQKVQGYVGRCSKSFLVMVHEFLHTIESELKSKDGGYPDGLKVHGPKPVDRWPKDFKGRWEAEWYSYIIGKIDWKKCKYRR